MLPKTYADLVGRNAVYNGVNRYWLFGDVAYKIVDARADGSSVRLDVENAPERDCWVATSSVKLVATDVDEAFSQALGGKEAVLDAEIARLEARLAELKAARKVLDSL